MSQPKLLYGGYVDGELDWLEVDDGFGGGNKRRTPALFRTWRAARMQYQDVRRMQVTEGWPKATK